MYPHRKLASNEMASKDHDGFKASPTRQPWGPHEATPLPTPYAPSARWPPTASSIQPYLYRRPPTPDTHIYIYPLRTLVRHDEQIGGANCGCLIRERERSRCDRSDAVAFQNNNFLDQLKTTTFLFSVRKDGQSKYRAWKTTSNAAYMLWELGSRLILFF